MSLRVLCLIICFGILNISAQCSYQCSTCAGYQSGISCTSCTINSHRTFTVFSCPCDTGYYDDGSDTTCVQCLHSCATCASSSTCATCTSADHRTFHQNLCPCDAGYYDDEVNQPCPLCSYTCLTCKVATNCLTCQSTSYRTIKTTTSQCPCNAGYYDDGSHSPCLLCNVACATCTSGTSCASCNPGYYYDASQPLCDICGYTCATCNDGSTCATCSSPSHRIFQSLQCPCNGGYYDDGSHQACVQCGYTCTTCTSGTTCATCSSTSQRTISLSQCPCNALYYDDGQDLMCASCLTSCGTCSSGTSCVTCPTSSYRTLVQSQCPCNAGYYDNGVATCVICSYTCITCTSGTTCSTCASSYRRTFDTPSSQCPCNPGYYDNGVANCALCGQLCQTCSNGSTCDTCKPGFYDNLSTSSCVQCSYTCATCTSGTSCSTCPNSSFRTLTSNSCVCNAGYYDDGQDATCVLCGHSCATCSSATICVTCPTSVHRTFHSSQCSCDAGYYDDEVNTPCVQCSYTCATCKNSNNCATCSSTSQRTINQSQCVCNQGYYDDGKDQACAVCSYTCASCTNSTTCSTCLSTSFRTILSSQCPCNKGYYDDGKNQLCLQCSYQCTTCTNGTSCLTCQTSAHRTFTQSQCPCDSGYYDDGTNTVCAVCSSKCATCTDGSSCVTFKSQYFDPATNTTQLCGYTCATCSDANTCTSCPLNSHRTMSQTLCPCDPGYYDDGTDPTCVQCSYSCASCTSSSSCTLCSSGFKQSSSSGTCVCQQTFSNNGVELCCDPSCKTCNGITNSNCTSCDTSVQGKRIMVTNQCLCIDGYYQDSSNQCSICNYSCKTCTTLLSCTSCESNFNRILSKNSCNCISNFYDDQINALCLQCDPTCLECNGGSQFQCLSCSTASFRQLISKQCVCQSNYYNFPATTQCVGQCPDGYYTDIFSAACQKCTQGCLLCTGPQITDCTSCASQKPFQCEIETIPSTEQYINNQVQLQGAVVKYACLDGTLSKTYPLGLVFQVSWAMIDSNGITSIESQSKSYTYPSIFTIPSMTAIAGQTYQFLFTVQQGQDKESTNTSITFTKRQFFVQIIDGNRTVSTQRDFNVTAQIFNLDLSNLPLKNIQDYKSQWSCTNFLLNKPCTDVFGQLITLNQSQSTQTFRGQIFQPLQTYQFQVKMIDSLNKQSSTQVYLALVEEDLPVLSLVYNPSLLQNKVNVNEEITITYIVQNEANPDNLYYSGSFFYDYEIVQTALFKFMTVQFKIENYFSDFNQASGSEFIFQASVYDPSFTITARASLKLNINIPPENCTMDISPTSGQEIQDIFTFSVYNCRDQQYPLNYRFSYYMNKSDQEKDVINGQQYRLISLTDYYPVSTFSTFLAMGSQEAKSQNIIIVAHIQDSLGGISNISQQIILQRESSVDGKAMLEDITSTSDQSQLMLKSLLYSQRLKYIINATETSTVKFSLLKSLKQFDFLNSSQFLQNQLLMAQNNLQQGQDMQNQTSLDDIFSDLRKLNKSLTYILKSQQYTITLYKIFGMCPQFQNQLNGNLLLTNRYSHIISDVLQMIQQNSVLNTLYDVNIIQSLQLLNKQALSIIDYLSFINLLGTQPNQAIPTMITNNFGIITQFVTKKGLNQATLAQFTSQRDGMSLNRRNNQQINTTQTSFYTLSIIYFMKNPKSIDDVFPYKNQSTSLINFKIKSQKNSNYNFSQDEKSKDINIYESVMLQFEPVEGLLSDQVCISYEDDQWNTQNCVTNIKGKNILCTCKTLGFYSVVNDLNLTFSQQPQQVNIIKAVAFSWFNVALFYILSSLSLLAIILAMWGYRQDQMFENQVHPIIRQEKLIFKIKDYQKALTQRISKKIEVEMGTHYDKSIQRLANSLNQSNNPSPTKLMFSDEKIPHQNDYKFAKYLLSNHPLTNIIYQHDEFLPRPMRVFLTYCGMLLFLSITVYFADELSLIRILAIMIVSSLMGNITNLIYQRCFESQYKLIKAIGIVFFMVVNFCVIYIIMTAVIADMWAIQYSISLVWDNMIFQVIAILFKYKLQLVILDGNSGCMTQIVRNLCLSRKSTGE